METLEFTTEELQELKELMPYYSDTSYAWRIAEIVEVALQRKETK